MTGGAHVDASEFRQIDAFFDHADASLAPQVRAVVIKGAVNVKAQMREEMGASGHFAGVARSIDFDTIEERDALEAEIGPRHGPGEAGNLANIAYFGVPSGGGGTVRDPQHALDAEAPRLESALGDILEGF